jgi:hypothetical protein
MRRRAFMTRRCSSLLYPSLAWRVHHAARRGGGVAARSQGGAGDPCNPSEANQAHRAAGPEFHRRTQGRDRCRRIDLAPAQSEGPCRVRDYRQKERGRGFRGVRRGRCQHLDDFCRKTIRLRRRRPRCCRQICDFAPGIEVGGALFANASKFGPRCVRERLEIWIGVFWKISRALVES